MRKRGEKTGGSINEKPSNLMRKQGGKPIIYGFLYYFAGGEKPPKPNEKNGRGTPDAD